MGYFETRRLRREADDQARSDRNWEREKRKFQRQLRHNEGAIVEELELLLAGKQPDSPEIQAATDYIDLVRANAARLSDFSRAFSLTSGFDLGVHQDNARASINPIGERIEQRSIDLGSGYRDTIVFIEQHAMPAMLRVLRVENVYSSVGGIYSSGADTLRDIVRAAPNRTPKPRQLQFRTK